MRCQITFVFQIRQAVPGGLAWAQNCCCARLAQFFIAKKMYSSSYNVFTCIPPFYVGQGSWEWVDGTQMTLYLFLILDNH